MSGIAATKSNEILKVTFLPYYTIPINEYDEK